MHTFAQPVLAGEPHSQARSLFISSLESMNSGRQEKLKEQLFSSRNSPLILSCLSGHGWRRRVRQWSERRHKSLPLDTNRTTSFSHRRRRSPAPPPPPRSSPPHPSTAHVASSTHRRIGYRRRSYLPACASAPNAHSTIVFLRRLLQPGLASKCVFYLLPPAVIGPNREPQGLCSERQPARCHIAAVRVGTEKLPTRNRYRRATRQSGPTRAGR